MTTFRELRVMIYTASYEDTCRFYADTLGLPVRETFRELGNRGTMFELGANVIEVFEADPRPEPGTALSVEVEDVRGLWDTISDIAPVEFALRHNAWGDTSFCIRDPNGLAITFFQRD